MVKSSPSPQPDLGAPQPKYARLAQAFLADIRAGRYPVGSMLPTEEQLCLQYGTSRATVRSALRVLQDRGYVRSQRPLGTRVLAAEVARRTSLSLASVSELIQLTAATRQKVTSIVDVVADAELAAEIGCPVGRSWRRVELLRWLSDAAAPSMLSRVCINPLYADVVQGVKLNRVVPVQAPYIDLIEARFGVRATEVRQAIGALVLPAALADSLGVPAGSPGLRIQRWFRSAQGDLVMYSNGTYSGLTFTYETTLRLDESLASGALA